ncbi:hypothetical protein EWB00_005612 [Schistosoma japonicum]|uniref:SJCHGC05043 protein n=1 Tax=Schistosoma japonicum TaxID=6182 RepID=Q5DE35_SCHJA|nr:SJCHGC05043 protein [Schistosoma japonicum]KAH8851263.1 hypothetical protein KSF78_0000761 [Schistosoma japonicum]KAH8851264.1 hypothetical protein KSF78_0000761 [Schistosoma japonicum]KAH8851265.1 hypothetical protein KSF78_0000761 [Schistosoma japonicum]TNN10174.1 hypothetical protein EWB00_005612 [Schistosoma japonicum]
MNEPLIIKELTAIPVSLEKSVIHFMYAKKLGKKSVLICNVHPLMDAKSLFNFFKLFGEITNLRYSPPEAQSVFEFRESEDIKKILTSPMNKIYEFNLTKIDIPERYLNRNPEWIVDYQKSKSESEAILQEYFKKRMEFSKKPDEDGWITVKKGMRL